MSNCAEKTMSTQFRWNIIDFCCWSKFCDTTTQKFLSSDFSYQFGQFQGMYDRKLIAISFLDSYTAALFLILKNQSQKLIFYQTVYRFYKTLQEFFWYITMSSNIFLALLMILPKLTPFLPIFCFRFFANFGMFW